MQGSKPLRKPENQGGALRMNISIQNNLFAMNANGQYKINMSKKA